MLRRIFYPFRFTYVAPSVFDEPDFRPRSMSRRVPRRPHPSGGTVPTVSEAMEYAGEPGGGGGTDAMDTRVPLQI